jgi:23S rRNA-/tRNA-specific pseudouridylate synthase
MKTRQFIHIVPSDVVTGQRLSKYIVGRFPYLETASAAKKSIKRGEIWVDDSVGYTGDWVVAGSQIEYKSQIQEKGPLHECVKVVFEDQHLLVLDKPPGLLSSGVSGPSLQKYLEAYPMSEAAGALFYPLLIHRLDRATCGLIIAARTIESRRLLGQMVEGNMIQKEYSMIAEGEMDDELRFIENVLDNKVAKTEILSAKNLDTKDKACYIRVRLHTGRTHQIRRHLSLVGCPIVGDDLYNKDGLTFGRGLFLMSDELILQHPMNDEKIHLEAVLHKKFSKYIKSKK